MGWVAELCLILCVVVCLSAGAGATAPRVGTLFDGRFRIMSGPLFFSPLGSTKLLRPIEVSDPDALSLLQTEASSSYPFPRAESSEDEESLLAELGVSFSSGNWPAWRDLSAQVDFKAKGGFGAVFKAHDTKAEKDVAVKIYFNKNYEHFKDHDQWNEEADGYLRLDNEDRDLVRKAQSEAIGAKLIEKRLQSPSALHYFVKLLEAHVGPDVGGENYLMYNIFEWVENTDLYQLMHPKNQRSLAVPYSTLKVIIFQLLEAIHHLSTITVDGEHSDQPGRQLIHHDLKATNIMYTMNEGEFGQIKIIDLGVVECVSLQSILSNHHVLYTKDAPWPDSLRRDLYSVAPFCKYQDEKSWSIPPQLISTLAGTKTRIFNTLFVTDDDSTLKSRADDNLELVTENYEHIVRCITNPFKKETASHYGSLFGDQSWYFPVFDPKHIREERDRIRKYRNFISLDDLVKSSCMADSRLLESPKPGLIFFPAAQIVKEEAEFNSGKEEVEEMVIDEMPDEEKLVVKKEDILMKKPESESLVSLTPAVVTHGPELDSSGDTVMRVEKLKVPIPAKTDKITSRLRSRDDSSQSDRMTDVWHVLLGLGVTAARNSVVTTESVAPPEQRRWPAHDPIAHCSAFDIYSIATLLLNSISGFQWFNKDDSTAEERMHMKLTLGAMDVATFADTVCKQVLNFHLNEWERSKTMFDPTPLHQMTLDGGLQLLLQMLHHVPEMRPTPAEAMNHRWFTAKEINLKMFPNKHDLCAAHRNDFAKLRSLGAKVSVPSNK